VVDANKGKKSPMRAPARAAIVTAPIRACERYYCSRMRITRRIKKRYFLKPIKFGGRIGCCPSPIQRRKRVADCAAPQRACAAVPVAPGNARSCALTVRAERGESERA